MTMATKAASSVKPAESSATEAIAYASVAEIPVAEPHDRDRIGFNVWHVLTDRRETLASAVHTAGARLGISEEEAVKRIREALRAKGVVIE
jgi:hypothetical protein